MSSNLPEALSVLSSQGLIQAIFGIGLPILGTLIWACPNSILNKIITTSKRNSSFLITSATQHEHDNEKIT